MRPIGIAVELLQSGVPGRESFTIGVDMLHAVRSGGTAADLAALAPRVSLDPASTVFQMGGILASVAARPPA